MNQSELDQLLRDYNFAMQVSHFNPLSPAAKKVIRAVPELIKEAILLNKLIELLNISNYEETVMADVHEFLENEGKPNWNDRHLPKLN